jgi:hypothetical protein
VLAGVDDRRREHGDAAVAMLLVVPVEEFPAVRLGVLEAVEAIRIVAVVLHGLVDRLGERVVVAYARSAVGAGDLEEIGEFADLLGLLRRSPIGMDGQRPGLDALRFVALVDEVGRELAVFGGREHPADDVAAEQIEHDVQRVALALARAAQPGHVPGPDFVGPRREQLGPREAILAL